MHAWAAVSHHLDYKGDWDVPNELRQALVALGGLFYVADNQFEQFNAVREKSRLESKGAASSDDDQDINFDTLDSYLRKKFHGREKGETSSISELVKELKSNGYSTIKDIERMLNRGDAAFRAYEQERPPASDDKRFVGVGVVRMTDRLVNHKLRGIENADRFSSMVEPE
jgi:hypothetical protein